VVFQHVTGEKVDALLDVVLAGQLPERDVLMQHRATRARAVAGRGLPRRASFFRPADALVLANCGIIDPAELDEYIARGGYEPWPARSRAPAGRSLRDVEVSGLRGRGGGFPTARSGSSLANPRDQKYLICNADEGDPGAFMDRA